MRPNIQTCQEHFEHNCFIAQCAFLSEVTNSFTLGGEMSESGWRRLKNVQRRSRENVCGLAFLLWSALMFSEPESATWNTQRERVKSLDAYKSTARHRPRLTRCGTAGSKREVLRNYIQLHQSKHTFSEHLCRLSCNLRHFTVQHKNMVGGITLYSLRSHQLT